jgi:uncharacterized membrane protein
MEQAKEATEAQEPKPESSEDKAPSPHAERAAAPEAAQAPSSPETSASTTAEDAPKPEQTSARRRSELALAGPVGDLVDALEQGRSFILTVEKEHGQIACVTGGNTVHCLGLNHFTQAKLERELHSGFRAPVAKAPAPAQA